MNSKRIVVTGGGGLVGSHLCARLLAEGHKVVCIDNLLSGVDASINRIMNNPRFEFIKHNVMYPINIKADQIYALAAPSSPEFFTHSPVETLKINLLGAINTFEAAKVKGTPTLIASSGDVYGNSRLPLQGEGLWGNVNPLSSRSANEEGKRAMESLAKAYHTEYKVPVKIARIFNTYGPGIAANDQRVLSKFIVNAIMGRDIVIYGNGMQTRCFCYVDDIVEGLIRLMNGTPDNYWSPVNFGSNHEVSIRGLAEKIILMTGSHSKIVHMTPMNDDPRHKTPDISRARQLLSWEPTTSLDSGLKQTIAYFQAITKEDNECYPAMSWSEMA